MADPVTSPDAPVPPLSDEALEDLTEWHEFWLDQTAEQEALGGGRDACAYCAEAWPCTTARLIARLRAAEAKVERFQMAGTLLDGQVRLGDHRVYRVADHWEGTIAGHRVALLIPLPDTPEEDDDGE